MNSYHANFEHHYSILSKGNKMNAIFIFIETGIGDTNAQVDKDQGEIKEAKTMR